MILATEFWICCIAHCDRYDHFGDDHDDDRMMMMTMMMTTMMMMTMMTGV